MLVGSSSNFSLTNGCHWETVNFFVTQKFSIGGHSNPMPNVRLGPDSFYLMYLNTGCGDKLKYSNKVFICKDSMWNANCTGNSNNFWQIDVAEKRSLFVAEKVSFQGNLNTHS